MHNYLGTLSAEIARNSELKSQLCHLQQSTVVLEDEIESLKSALMGALPGNITKLDEIGRVIDALSADIETSQRTKQAALDRLDEERRTVDGLLLELEQVRSVHARTMDSVSLDHDLADIHESDLQAVSAEHDVVMREMLTDTQRLQNAIKLLNENMQTKRCVFRKSSYPLHATEGQWLVLSCVQ